MVIEQKIFHFVGKYFMSSNYPKIPSILHQEGTSSCSYRDSSNFPSGFSVLHHHQKIIDRSELHRTFRSPLFDSMPRPQAVSLLDYEEKILVRHSDLLQGGQRSPLNFGTGIRQTINDDSLGDIFNFIGNTCSCTLRNLFFTRRSLGVAEAIRLTQFSRTSL